MLKKILLLIVGVTFVIACTEGDDTGSMGVVDNFNRQAMLTNLADNIIIPAYQDLNTKLDVLVSDKESFIANPNQTNLETLRTSWLNAYKTWQYVELFNIGKAEETFFYFQMNIYPANTIDIENNIASGTADLTHSNNNDAVGFPALDYMLYGLETTDATILEKYTTNANAEKYKTHLSDLIVQMKSLTETMLNDWTSSYKNEFISSTSNTASSAVNKFVNDFIFYYEKGIRTNKIGTPAGNFSATPLPEKVEAFYNKEVSKTLALEALKSVKNVFNGKHYNGTATGVGFSDYLIELNRADLNDLINEKFDIAKAKIELLDNNFYNQVNNDNTKMTEAYDALQATIVLMKIDMLQTLNISVDYYDGDND